MTSSTSPAALVVPPPNSSTNAVVPETLRDVKPPVPIRSPWALAIGGILIALLVALLLLWWLRRRRRKPAEPVRVMIPPHRRALDKLRAALDLLHDPMRFIVQVADTLRVYLEERFQLNAPERTTEEFLDELQGTELLTGSQKETLSDFLVRCDLVKFAQDQPSEFELRGLWDMAMNLVSDTAEPLSPAGRLEQVEGVTLTENPDTP